MLQSAAAPIPVSGAIGRPLLQIPAGASSSWVALCDQLKLVGGLGPSSSCSWAAPQS